MVYRGDPLCNCSTLGLFVNQPVSGPCQTGVFFTIGKANVKASMVCNTTTNQLIELEALGVINSLSVNADVFTQSYDLAFTLLNSSEPLNITEVVTLWYFLLVATLEMIAPTESMSVLFPSVVKNNFSSLAIGYSSTSNMFISL